MSVIQTNIAALNAQRNLANTNMRLSSSIARLSSGFRINRAADDAAGLGIANKMRADLRGFRQASRNAAQANAVVQTAEGAASTIGFILDRMKELAAQGASDNVTSADRVQLDAEFTALKSEITRIVDTTKYQGQKLVSGSFGNAEHARRKRAVLRLRRLRAPGAVPRRQRPARGGRSRSLVAREALGSTPEQAGEA